MISCACGSASSASTSGLEGFGSRCFAWPLERCRISVTVRPLRDWQRELSGLPGAISLTVSGRSGGCRQAARVCDRKRPMRIVPRRRLQQPVFVRVGAYTTNVTPLDPKTILVPKIRDPRVEDTAGAVQLRRRMPTAVTQHREDALLLCRDGA